VDAVFFWIVGSGVLMGAIAMVGSVTLLLGERALQRILLPLVPFAAGNFIYIGASDLIPEVKSHADAKANLVHFAAFSTGIGLMLAVKLVLER
jgi:zinc and cadmium transporter